MDKRQHLPTLYGLSLFSPELNPVGWSIVFIIILTNLAIRFPYTLDVAPNMGKCHNLVVKPLQAGVWWWQWWDWNPLWPHKGLSKENNSHSFFLLNHCFSSPYVKTPWKSTSFFKDMELWVTRQSGPSLLCTDHCKRNWNFCYFLKKEAAICLSAIQQFNGFF